MRTRLVLLFCFTVLITVAAFAADLTGRDLVLPIVARVPGSVGSDWRTDVVLTNTDNRYITDPPVVTLTTNVTLSARLLDGLNVATWVCAS